MSTDAEAHYGPVVNAAHKQRVENWIQTGVDEGAELVVDGRGFTLQGHENGFFIGPTLFDRVTPDMSAYKEEIFGPVLQIVRAARLRGTRSACPSEHQYGNGVAIFTRNGHAAREFAAGSTSAWSGSTCRSRCRSPITASAAGSVRRSATPTSTAWKASGSGPSVKTVTQRWPDGSAPAGDGRGRRPGAQQRRLRHPDDGVSDAR